MSFFLRRRLTLRQLEDRSVPATFVVTNLLDAGPGSLRQAVLNANASNDPLDTVDARGVSGVITLQSFISINGSTDLIGPGANKLAVSGGGVVQLFDSTVAPAFATVTFDGLTLTQGHVSGDNNQASAGIYSWSAALVVRNCLLAGNSTSGVGGAIYQANGPLTIQDTTIAGNSASFGGGVITFGPAINIQRSTFLANVATSKGGGIFAGAFDSLTIESTTFSGNSANFGSAIAVNNWQAAIPVTNLSNTTVSESQVAGLPNEGVAIWLFQVGGYANLKHTTITNNACLGMFLNGGVPGGFTLNNSIVAKNMYDVGGNSELAIGGNNNFIGTGIPTGIIFSGSGNLIGSNSNPIEPLLAPLANNGGPTPTHALLPGSPAINSGALIPGINTDQRGIVRDAFPDIGAYELRPLTASVTVNDGSAQRSKVNQLNVTFSEPATFPGGLAAGITLTRTEPGGPTGNVPLSFVQNGQTITATISDPAFAPFGGSLIDGNYSFTLNSSAITATAGPLDGDGDGVVGGDFTLNFHRLFGDANGDRTVNGADFLAFRSALMQPSATFDFDGDGTVNASDFLQFRLRFLVTI